MITIFKNIFDTSDPMWIDIYAALKRIKDGNKKELILSIRKETEKQARNQLKKRLPSICFSGRFSERVDSKIIEHSGYICLDIDELTTKQITSNRALIEKDTHTFSCFVSPSGNGLKVLLKIPNSIEEHKNIFRAIKKYYQDTFDITLDESGVNISRVCYESYDPDLFYNPDSEIWCEILEETTVNAEMPITNQDKTLDYLRKWIDSKMTFMASQKTIMFLS